MHIHDVIIIGGGPAGAACAKELTGHGADVLLLDRQSFPRQKLCAGWITPRVFKDLKTDPSDYPHGILCFKKIFFHIKGMKFSIKTCQYSIRRVEFDHWLLKKSKVMVLQHHVKNIKQDKDHFIIDNLFKSRFIVGAGGTNCPVARIFFRSDLNKPLNKCIVALEKEFKAASSGKECHLWFLDNNLPGYAWYVPKKNGYLNIGIGGKLGKLKQKNTNINQHWDYFINMLVQTGRLKKPDLKPKGYKYFLNSRPENCRKGNAFIAGDALGLATIDMGEGTGPAVKSGIMAARSIISGQKYKPDAISKFSIPSMIASGFKF